jgi:hypothetical protein
VEMLRQDRRDIALLLPIALVGLIAFASSAFGQKTKKETVAFTPPNLSLLAEPSVITVCEGAGPALVHLNARATSSYPIRYRWTTNGGRIEGDGATVTWDLSGMRPGYYKAYVDIDVPRRLRLRQFVRMLASFVRNGSSSMSPSHSLQR